MKVILLKDVKGVGKKQEIVNVKDGYGSNYLIPNGLAVQYSSKSLEILNQQKADEKEQIRLLTEEAKKVAEALKGITLEFTSNCGADGKMFGTISTKQIEQELKNKYNIVVDKRKIISKTAVDRIGFTKLEIELYKGVIGVITVHVSANK